MTLEDRLVAAFQRVAAVVGNPIDWAGRLNAGLTAPTGGGLATEALVGQTQLATQAEALAGTLGTKGLSALRHNGVHVATSLDDLNTKVLTLPSGSVIALSDVTFSTNNVLYRSLWYAVGGTATPVGKMVASTKAALDALFAACGTGKTYGRLNLDPFVSEAYVYRNVGTDSTRDLYRYIGTTTGWLLWKGRVGVSFASGVVTRDNNTNYVNEGWADGDGMNLDLMVSGAAASPGLIAALVGTNIAPPIDVFLSGAYIDQSTVGTSTQWRPVNVYVSADAGIRLLTGNITTNWALGLSGRFKRKVPTA